MGTKLTIGKVAAAAEVNVETIRFYQRRGIIAEPPKKLGGLRYYDETAIERVRFVKRAQSLGFSLEEVVGLLELHAANVCAKTHDAAERKLAMVEDRIRDLQQIQMALKKLIGQCEEGVANVSCPIIDALQKSEVPQESSTS